MEIGIVGLPNVGKSTLFNALAKAQAPASNYPYCTIEPNIATIEVPDSRLEVLAEVVKPKKLSHPLLKFVDIAGLARGAHKGEGLGNLFLSHIRNVDAIVHTVRCFEDASVIHVEGQVDPKRDVEIIEAELFLSDLEIVERRIAKISNSAKSGDEHARKEMGLLIPLKEMLNHGKRFEDPQSMDHEVEGFFKDLKLLSSKPVLFCANVDEDFGSEAVKGYVAVVEGLARERQTMAIPICARLEAEIGELPPEEGKALLKEMGFEESAIQRFVRACYDLLQVVTFFTIKGEETRGWTVRRGTGARDAAGKIHTDMSEKFVCAEVISLDEFRAAGGMAPAREKGLVRTEGKNYVVRDGDIVLVKFGK
ncbi:MAG TPA: redox-regulated ATPase YchF [bacterium]|nr:redox-regulated ATPase YchF [bacterium]